ncbi:MAG: UDP-N-acetylmuramate dehydrogenase [Myxococcota bacterium]|nr:UDP-N-acetylmuramate dehydrogenase [Deltaproteobacteria bacterium]MDQ3339225.1 UDP-N-acetylmuramate dehydrogenase [Myxococcota bacterium]
MRVDLNVALAPRTTLGIGGEAARFAKIESVRDIRDALAGGGNILVLGGGSNLVVRDGGFDGLVVQMAIPGISVDDTRVSVSAGVVWDDFVGQMVDAKLHGIECMSGIPGLVGATPMQNVGAYGQEVSDTITAVRVFDRESGRVETMTPAQCGFAYRTSNFKGSERWIILDIELQLSRHPKPIRYPELAAALGVGAGGMAPISAVRKTVLALRRKKGMVVDPDDPDSRSAGSFFTNPIVDADTLAQLEARLPGVTFPRWPAGDKTKLSAGWLIERAGFSKGDTRGKVGISSKHALALVNLGGATATELLALAREIQDGVRDRLGIELHPEPVIVGHD